MARRNRQRRRRSQDRLRRVVRSSSVGGGCPDSEHGNNDSESDSGPKKLGRADYPTDKASLIKRAKEKRADENVLNALNRMGASNYNSPNDVSEEMGKLR